MRATAYRRWLRPIAMVEACNDAPVSASIITYRLGQITLAQSTSSPVHYLRDEDTIEKGRFGECLLLRLLIKGSVHGWFGDAKVDIKEGDIYLSDLAQTSEVWLEGDCAHINVMMRRADLGDITVHGRVLHGEWLPCRMLREHLLNFIDILRHCDADNVKEMTKATMELLRFCLRTDDVNNKDTGYFLDEARERIVTYIDEHLSESDLGALRLQREFAVSRSQLYRHFAELGGVQHYIRNKRLQAVLRDLCNEPHRSITDIIERYGFTTERQFQRAFRARFGMTASQVRADWKSKAMSDICEVIEN
ncbi:helix-turn-helix domain-containing protein [Dyella monticola]|nr:helix-turn-helix domain-containing protein [Dyella monticola]